jgi:adenine-specific DNA-methyltransferase
MPIESIKHNDKRSNNPTEELRDFVKDDKVEKKLYPRDSSLDPQLVWKGKDEQDSSDLSVPIVPIYVQEQIQPQAIIEDLRTRGPKSGETFDMFADLKELEFEEAIDFYKHEKGWANRVICGDSLTVMTSLSEKENLKAQIQMIYIDPPYGIKFGSNWQVSTRKRDVKDRAEDTTRQPEQVKAYRDTWELGIHSYLSYLRDRLVVARELLVASGSIFVQIGDENVHLVRNLMDEVFGADNFVSMIAYRTKNMMLGGNLIESINDYVLWYAKDRQAVKYNKLFRKTIIEGDNHWNLGEDIYGNRFPLSKQEVDNHQLLRKDVADICQLSALYPAGVNESGLFSLDFKNRSFSPPVGRSWKTNPTGMNRLILANRVEPYSSGDTLRYVLKFSDYPVSPLPSLWTDTAPPSDKIYAVQTNNRVIERCILMTTQPGDLVLDPTCGSGTTAYVAELWGRRWITIDTSRVALALARTRMMSAKFPYYVLADSPEGKRLEADSLPDHLKKEAYRGNGSKNDIKKGFIYDKVPHITLKSIANNESIEDIWEKWQKKLAPALRDIHDECKKAGLKPAPKEEWDVPRLDGDVLTDQQAGAEIGKATAALKKLLNQYWELRRSRQQEIDASIQRNADMEILYDRPKEDSKRIRVTGPFTVESLSPHRMIASDVELPKAERKARNASDGGVEQSIIEYLRKAGVQNTKRKERLEFDRLDICAGRYIHAEGEYKDKGGELKRVAVFIGPEHGTVTPDEVKEAAKEAVKGTGYDLLLILGFAFEAHAEDEAKEFGKLTVLLTRMNPDLLMSDELLKKTGSANLFMVFGEPDIKIDVKGDKVTVKIKGLDIYDPTTGEVRSHSTDDIACWFIDTNYNSEAFFVRHAYFTGAQQPYEKLKKALRAEIDEDAWAKLYSTDSRSFPKPKTGKIAVKVINHYGDEVIKVYEVK